MNEEINYHIQDANALDETLTRNLETLTAKGFSAELQSTLQTQLADLISKEKEQNRLTYLLADFTSQQNTVLGQTTGLVEKIRAAAKTEYDESSVDYKLFNIGKRIPHSLNGLRSLCESLVPIVAERSAVLLKSGLIQDDITALNGAAENLLSIDKTQEDTKKQKEQSTVIRNNSNSMLKKTVKKIRNFVKAAFRGNKEMLVQFEPIPKGRGKGGGEEDQGGGEGEGKTE